MGKKKKKRKIKNKKEATVSAEPFFIEKHWDKIIIILLFLLPLLYFASFLNSNKMIGGSDYLNGGYPFEAWTVEQPEMPLWYPHVFGGVPVLGSPVGGPLAPLAQLRVFIPPHVVLALTFIIFFFFAGLGTYLYLKEIGLSQYSAAVGAVIYQFIGNLATTPMAGHAGRAASVAMFPLLIFFIHRGLRTKKILFFLLFSFAAAFTFYEGHFQITYYSLLFILCYVLYYFISRRKELSKKDYFRFVGYGVFSIAVLCLLMAAVWLPVLGGLGIVARGVERGYEYAVSWAMPPLELIDLVIPGYSGILDNYWGFNTFKIHLEYFGLLALILSVFTIILFWKKRYVKFYTIASLIALLVALGGATPVFRIFYTLVPGFKLTRAPSLIFYLVSFAFVVLGTIGFDNLIVHPDKIKNRKFVQRNFLIISGIIAGALLITGLICAAGSDSIVTSMQQSFGSQLINQWGKRAAEMKLMLISKNFPNFLMGIWRSLLFSVMILAVVFLGLNKRLRLWNFAVIAIIITLFDQLPLMRKFLPSAPAPAKYYAADDVVRFIKKDKAVFRVFPTLYCEHARDLYFLYHDIQSVGGYIPNPIQRYQDFIGAGTSVMFSPANLFTLPGQTGSTDRFCYKFINMLNIKYIIGPILPEDISRYDPQSQQAIIGLREYFSEFNLVFRGRQYSVYRNSGLLPRAYLVSDYLVAKDSAILDILKSPEYEPEATVILEKEPSVSGLKRGLPMVPAEIIKYSANEVVCGIETPYPGFLVLADNWHPDWKVFVDGKEQELYRADYTFRAVYVPAGDHEVVFKYISPYFNIGSVISIITLVLSVLLCIAAIKLRL